MPDSALQWTAEVIGPGANVVSVRRLTGGVTSDVHAIALQAAHSRRRVVVLRRWVGDHPVDRVGSVRREAAILERLASTDLPSPRLLASDPTGARCGVPALLMSRLPGRIDLAPKDPVVWLERIAAALARIHDTVVDAPAYESWLELDDLVVPAWTTRPQLWRDAFELVATEPPPREACFVHHDFQQFNLLWSRGRVSGVVDWIWASIGPPDVDVAHCRLNLAVLYSPEHAERFGRAYEAITGRTVHPWWDVAGLLAYLPGWGRFLQQQAGRRRRVDFGGMHERVELTLAASLSRA